MRRLAGFALLALTLTLVIPTAIIAPAQACEAGKDGK
jgi:hypothetical protein